MSGSSRNALIICASVLALAALYFARSVFAPAAVSLFAVAVVWPVQKWLEQRLPQLIALAITLLLTVFILSTLLTLSVWGIGQVGRWMVANAAHLQELYVQLTQWLESHGIFVMGIFLERFDVAWLVRPAQELASIVRTLVAFAMLVLVFMMLALLEVRDFKAKLQAAMPNTDLETCLSIRPLKGGQADEQRTCSDLPSLTQSRSRAHPLPSRPARA